MTSAQQRQRHGLSRHPLYRTWCGMVYRCENPNDSHYKDYGGRGITVCPEWHDVAVFIADIESSIGPRPARRYTSGRLMYSLDRIDNERGYEPGNVKWSDYNGQAGNRRPKPGRNRIESLFPW